MFIEGEIPNVVTNTGNNNGYNDSFGGGWMFWIVIILLFAFGNNGWGTRNGGAADNYVLASDFATLQRQINSGISSLERKGDAINNGLCDGFYAMNTGMLTGFAGVNNAVMSSGYEMRSALNDLGYKQQECCCTTQRSIDGVNYNIATQFSNLNSTLCTLGRDIVDNQNANYRALHDEIVANRIEDKNAQITAQQNEITALRLAASQSAQNAYLLSELKPCPKPAYITCNPYQSYPYYTNVNCGCPTSSVL